MTVTACVVPATVSSPPGTAAAFVLHVHNAADEPDVVKLAAAGELAAHIVLPAETVYLEPGETFEAPIVVDVGPTQIAGRHSVAVTVTTQRGESSTAEGTLIVDAAPVWIASLVPERSGSASQGRHRIAVENSGNVALIIKLTAIADSPERTADIRLGAPLVEVAPGASAKVDVWLLPRRRFWNGEAVDHPFSVVAVGSNGQRRDLIGVWAQGPRLRRWFLPALVGAVGALLIGTLAWLTVLRPSVESIADERAEAANEADREQLEAEIAELRSAAAEAARLPLGTPDDLRLVATADPGATDEQTFSVASDRVLSVTDVVFQNPSGAVGRVALLRSGEVILESELANFRDLDLHFVAPFRFEGSDTVGLRVECRTPGPDEAACNVSATIIGFVDDTD